MKVRTRGGAVLIVLGALAGASCDERLSDLTGPSPNLLPTFASIQQEIFQTTDLAGRPSCVTCHTSAGRTPAAGLNLAGDGYGTLVNVPSGQQPQLLRVKPGDPENSYLIQKLEGRSTISGLRMPRGGPYLTVGQMRVIRRWIEIGAPR